MFKVSKRLLTPLLLAGFLGVFLTGLLPGRAFADPPFDNPPNTAAWVNRSTINYGGVNFVDSDTNDQLYHFIYADPGRTTCTSTIDFGELTDSGFNFQDPYGDTQPKVYVSLSKAVPGPSGCQPGLPSPGYKIITMTALTNRGGDAGPQNDFCASVPEDPAARSFMCPLIEVGVNAIERIDNTILGLITINTDNIFGGPDQRQAESSNAYYQAWGAFRNIALILLVIFGLVMVASQVLNLEIFSAYTIKKMLPRMVIATIFTLASWQIMEFLFRGANASAFAIMDLIKTPFSEIDPGLASGKGDIALAIAIPTLLIVGTPLAIGALAILGFGGILALIATIVLAVISAIAILILRDVVATILIIMAPIAIMCSAFEPFQKLFSLWKGLLITLLLSLPGVGALLMLSHMLALILWVNDHEVFSILALGIGYFFIFAVLKQLDQISGKLGNLTSKFTGGAQKWLSDYRGNQFKNRGRLWKQGSLFSEGGIGGSFNNLGRRVGAAEAISTTKGRGALGAFVGRDRKAGLSLFDQTIRDQMENDPMMKAIANNDDANAVLAGSGGIDTDEALARSAAAAGLTGDRARNAISTARSVGVNRAHAMTALRTSMKNKARGISVGNVRFMDQAVRSLSRNEAEYQGLAQEAAFFARSSGRADLGGTDWISYATSGQKASQSWQQARQVVQAEEARRTTTPGATPMTNQERETLMWQSLSDSTIMDGVGRLGVQAMVGGHDNQVIQAMDTFSRVLTTSANPQDRIQAAVALKEIQGNMPAGASGTVRDAINKVLYNSPDDPARPGLGLNPSSNIAQQLAVEAGLPDDPSHTLAGQTLTTMGRTYGEFTGAEEAARRAGGGGTP